ncbi:uncharacterized protein V6R79_008019 [Siganus canaliculatus]
MADHEREDWFEREEFIGQISDLRVQNLQVEREVVQKRTFTRWMNLHLEKCNPPIKVHDLFRDIQDGHILMALLEELSGCKLLHGFKKSSHRIFRLNNIAKVLSFLEERNVKLVSIDAADVANGNSSIILGLIWNIILFFQIKELTGNIRSQFPSSSSLSSIPTSSDSDTPSGSRLSDERQSTSMVLREHSKAIKKLLQWVQKRTRKFGVAVQDFGKSWTSGLAFLAVIKSIDSSLVNMRKALLRSARENLEEAFRIAHYSLGIPQLLEPEDLTINAPDEQSIMTYVAQFLEHFPCSEETEESCHLIERSVSLCRLNFRDSDPDYSRNGAQGRSVREKSYIFQRDRGQLPPKILVSSVSEDRGTMSCPFRSAAARSWSSEDILADSPVVEDVPRSVMEEPKDTAMEILTSSTSDSPHLSYNYSPTGSSALESEATESLIVDSAISSPDSWVGKEFGVTPEKFCSSQSDSSLCDSGTAWDVYRATPVEITTLDEGFASCIEDRTPDDQSTTESYFDEGIYSGESTKEKIKEHSVNKQMKEVSKNHNSHSSVQQIVDQSEVKLSKETDSKLMDRVQEVPREQEASLGPCDVEFHGSSSNEDLVGTEKTNKLQFSSSTDLPPSDNLEVLRKQTNLEEHSGKLEDLKKAVCFNNTEEAEVETECQNINSPSEETREGPREARNVKGNDGVIEAQDNANAGVFREHEDIFSSDTCDILANTHLYNQDRTLETNLGASTGMDILLISISGGPERQDREGTCDIEIQDHVGDDVVHLVEKTENKGNDSDIHLHEGSCDLSGKAVEIPFFMVSENATPTTEQIVDIKTTNLDDTEEPIISQSLNYCERSNAKEKYECPKHNSQASFTEDLEAQNFSADAIFQPVNTQPTEEITCHLDSKEMAATPQHTADPVDSQQNDLTRMSCCEAGNASRDTDVLYKDLGRNSPTDDIIGDPIEPMDLFYPDKEEPMFTEPLGNEMLSWPSVLSVSALQPAPASKNQPEDESFNLLDDDFRNRVDSELGDENVFTETRLEAYKTLQSQGHYLLPREERCLWDSNVPADSSDLKEAEQRSSSTASENTELVRTAGQDEIQMPPVLHHRNGLRFAESPDHPTAVIRNADDHDFWRIESWELHLLLLLWLLLYCFWLLPQVDLKTLPGMLLNFHH